MAEEEQIQKSSEDLLIEKLHENVEIVCNSELDQRMTALTFLIEELRKSTSSMTSVPKPMKHLLPAFDDLVRAYNTFTNQDFKTQLADLLSLLSIVSVETSYDILKYRIACPIENIGSWGHEYVRCLTLAIVRAFKNPETIPEGTDLLPLIAQLSKYYMAHNDEPDACDLLIQIGRLRDIIHLVDEESHERVCIYLLQCYNYLPDPINFEVLRVLIDIYEKLGKTEQALVIALKLNDRNRAREIFHNCQDILMKKQLAFLLARQLIVFDDEMDEELTAIATNTDLFSRFIEIVERLGKKKAKTPDDVLQFQATIGSRNAPRNDTTLHYIAKSFVSAFHNAGIKEDLYYTAQRGEDIVNRNKGAGKAVAVATLGMLNLWDIENGPNTLNKWLGTNDSNCIMGALTGVGIVSAAVRSEYDPAIALLRDFLAKDGSRPEDIDYRIGAIFGLAMAYAGSAREDVLSLLAPVINGQDPRVDAFASLAIGLIFVGSRNDAAISAISQLLFSYPNEIPEIKHIIFIALAFGLLFLGQQSECEVALAFLDAIPSRSTAEFVKIAIESCAYAGTGNVLQIQKLLSICTGPDSISHSVAVLGIAIIAIGDSIGCQMSKRMFEHIMQHGKAHARRMVPIAIALTSVSHPQPELIDTLHRIGHDTDINVAKNATLALGIIAAGTMNTRAINTLRALEQFHKSDSTVVMLLQVAIGLCHLGQGLMTLSPTYGDSLLIHPVALSSLLVIAYASIHTEEIIVKSDPLLLFFVAPAIGPRFLVTLDENLQICPLQVRVGQAIDVVGQAGKPRAITGFQTLETPVILEAGKRAEFVDENIEPLSPILEGFVIVRKKQPKSE